MSTTAQYASIPRAEYAVLTVANTDRTGATAAGMVDLFTPGASGSRVDDILICSTSTSTAGAVAFFMSDIGNTTNRLMFEVIVPAITVSATVSPFMFSLRDLGIVLPATRKIRITSRTVDVIHVCVTKAGDF